jgi:hypothetical protein
MIHYRGKMVPFAVTQHFSLCGWSGINIEPLPELHRKFVSARPHEINLNVALSDHPGVLDLVAKRSYPGLSTATLELAEDARLPVRSSNGSSPGCFRGCRASSAAATLVW